MMKLSMVILVALVGAVSAANLNCPKCVETEKGTDCTATSTQCDSAAGRCYSISYTKTPKDGTAKEYFMKGCAVPTATDELTVFGLVNDAAVATYTALKAEWCNTDACNEYSARLNCFACDADVTDIDTLCDAADTTAFCGVAEQCASVFYMAADKAHNTRMCKVKSDPKEWECADKEKQSGCGIKFCNEDKCTDYSSSMSAAIALPLLLVAIVNAYF